MQKFDKSVEKKRLRMFWTDHWTYWSLETWIKQITDAGISSYWKNKYMGYLKDALKKLTLEKKIKEQELFSLLDMLDSPDDENKTIVLFVIKKYKKTKFKKT